MTKAARTKRLAVSVLRKHGAPGEHLAVLSDFVGKTFPPGIEEAGDVLSYLIRLLPWPSLHPLLKRWTLRAQERASIEDERLAKQSVRVLTDFPRIAQATNTAHTLDSLIDTMKHARGIKSVKLEEFIRHTSLDDVLRAWIVSFHTARAALTVAALEEPSNIHTYALGTFAWTMSQVTDEESEHEFDLMMRELIEALARYYYCHIQGVHGEA